MSSWKFIPTTAVTETVTLGADDHGSRLNEHGGLSWSVRTADISGGPTLNFNLQTSPNGTDWIEIDNIDGVTTNTINSRTLPDTKRPVHPWLRIEVEVIGGTDPTVNVEAWFI